MPLGVSRERIDPKPCVRENEPEGVLLDTSIVLPIVKLLQTRKQGPPRHKYFGRD